MIAQLHENDFGANGITSFFEKTAKIEGLQVVKSSIYILR